MTGLTTEEFIELLKTAERQGVSIKVTENGDWLLSRANRQVIEFAVPWPPKELSPNLRPHWAAKAAAAKKYNRACFYAALEKTHGIEFKAQSYTIQLRFMPSAKRKRDDDNLTASFKHGRDGIAKAMGIDDNILKMLPVIVDDRAGAKLAHVVVRIEECSICR